MEFTPWKLLDYGMGTAALFLFAQFNWYLIQTVIPRIVTGFREEMTAQRAEQKADREQHDRHMTSLVGAMEAMSKRVDVLEGDLVEIRDAILSPRLRIHTPGDDPNPAS